MLNPKRSFCAIFLLFGCSSQTGAVDGAPSNVPSGGMVTGGGSASTDMGGAGVGGSNATGGIATSAGTAGDSNAGGGGAAGSASAGMAGTGGADRQGQPIDFAMWELQLPIGSGSSVTTISPSELVKGFSNEYFYAAPDGGQIFMDPATGITTSGSQHCRTEMREMTRGGALAAWPPTGTNSLTVSGQVLQVGGGAKGNVAVAQVFNGTDSIPLCELSYSTSRGGFALLYEEAKGAGSVTDLQTKVALKTPYTFTLALSNGVLTVDINGQQVYTHMPSASTLGKMFYFKFGNYDQTATSGPISTAPYTLVEVTHAAVVHP